MTTRTAQEPQTNVRSLPGTHECVFQTALRHGVRGGRALDLGAWGGGLAHRLQSDGFAVTAADVENQLEVSVPFVQVDFNNTQFETTFDCKFDLVTAVEVIEHLENPTAFLRSIGKLLKPEGLAIVTTPNVENAAGRLKFFRSGTVRIMDYHSPEHISPIFLDLFKRQMVPRAGLQLEESFVHLEESFPLTARRYLVPFFYLLMPLMKGGALAGDCHVFVLKAKRERTNLAVDQERQKQA